MIAHGNNYLDEIDFRARKLHYYAGNKDGAARLKGVADTDKVAIGGKVQLAAWHLRLLPADEELVSEKLAQRFSMPPAPTTFSPSLIACFFHHR